MSSYAYSSGSKKSASSYKSDDKDDKKSNGKSSDKGGYKDCDDDRNDKGKGKDKDDGKKSWNYKDKDDDKGKDKDKGKDHDDDCDDKGHGKGKGKDDDGDHHHGKGHHHGGGKGHDSHGNGNGYGHHHGCGDDDDDGQTDNKPAVFSGDSTGTVQEDGTLTTGGILTVTDPDAGESAFASTGNLQGEHGEFSFDLGTGAWSYALNNADATVQALNAGETLQDSLLVTSTDGSSEELTVTIEGADEAPPADPALLWVINLDTNGVVRTDSGDVSPIVYFDNDGYAVVEGFTSNDVLNHNGIQLDGTYEWDVDGDEAFDDTVASFSYLEGSTLKTLEVGLIDFVGIVPAVNLSTDLVPL